MSKILETKSLVIKQETKFDKIIKAIYQIFFREEYLFEMELEELTKLHRPNPTKIIIPKEMICLVRLESDKTICQVASLQHYAV